MKQFKFPFQALLQKSRYEERLALYDLAQSVSKRNAIEAQRSAITANIGKWRRAARSQQIFASTPHAMTATQINPTELGGGITLQGHMRTYLTQLAEENAALEKELAEKREKVLLKRQHVKKIERLKQRYTQQWQRYHRQYKWTELTEKILNGYYTPTSPQMTTPASIRLQDK